MTFVTGDFGAVTASGSTTVVFWLAAGQSYDEVRESDKLVRERTPSAFLARTKDYWRLWTNKDETIGDHMSPELTALYRRSTLIIRTQVDNRGAIIAGNDSDVLRFNRDTYSYLWPRDGALVADARRSRGGALSALENQIAREEAHLKALEEESRRLTAVIRGSLSRSTGAVSTQGFIWPLNGRVTSGFGYRRGHFHAGIDIDGTTVRIEPADRAPLADRKGFARQRASFACTIRSIIRL